MSQRNRFFCIVKGNSNFGFSGGGHDFFRMALWTRVASLGLEYEGLESLSDKKKNAAARLLAFVIDKHEPSL